MDPEHPFVKTIVEQRDAVTQWREMYYGYVTDSNNGPGAWRNTPLTQFGFDVSGPLLDQYGKPTTGTLGANERNALIAQLGTKVRGSDFNPAITFAEGFKSLDMISESVTSIARSLAALKKGRFADAWKYLVRGTERHRLDVPKPKTGWHSDVSQNWLAMKLGWMPLLTDTFNAAEAAASTMTPPASMRLKVQKTSRGESSGPTHGRYLKRRLKLHRISIIAIMTERVDSTLSFGLQHPELVAWEVLPYSFVFDYLCPIGTWLEARASASSMTGTFVETVVTKDVYGPTITGGGKWPTSGDFYYEIVGGVTHTTSVQITRTVTNTLSVERPTMKPLSKAASVTHVATSLALLAGVVSRTVAKPR